MPLQEQFSRRHLAAAAQRGYTLIEVLMVVAIIGLLASLAIPAFETYLVRSRVTEGLSLVSRAKQNVAEIAQSGIGRDAAVGYAAGFLAPANVLTNPTRNVAAVAIDPAGGWITVTFTAAIAVGGPTLVLVPYLGTEAAPVALPPANIGDGAPFAPVAGEVRWRCRVTVPPFAVGIPGTLDPRFAPKECQ